MNYGEIIERLGALSPEQKRVERKHVCRQLTNATRLLLKPHPVDRRAWLSGYVEWARKALEALR